MSSEEEPNSYRPLLPLVEMFRNRLATVDFSHFPGHQRRPSDRMSYQQRSRYLSVSREALKVPPSPASRAQPLPSSLAARARVQLHRRVAGCRCRSGELQRLAFAPTHALLRHRDACSGFPARHGVLSLPQREANVRSAAVRPLDRTRASHALVLGPPNEIYQFLR